jgi:hypothetical protein
VPRVFDRWAIEALSAILLKRPLVRGYVRRAIMSTMTVVLVHGNPETDAIWDLLVDALGRDDVVRLSPP